MDYLILVPVLLPVVGGICLLAGPFQSGRRLHCYTAAILGISASAALVLAWTGEWNVVLFTLLEDIPICFHVDAVGRWFVTVVSLVWLLSCFYAFAYMQGEEKEKRYFGVYLILYGVLVALDFAGNLVTLYAFYEMMTLVSVPLVMHNGTKEAVMAALKYLFYSMCGAYGGLFGIYFLNRYCSLLAFVPGGTLDGMAVQGREGLLLAAVFVMLVGFGVKAGMIPFHGWLPTAHPVAPSPASAVLSGIIVKSGVLAMIRVVYYVVGPRFLQGTWVQYVWMILTLLTVFMGSMLAYLQKNLKKRLAYSTVSQVSYILFGLSLLSPLGFAGALIHVAVHALVKCGLFLVAGVFLHQSGITRVDQLTGIGRKMPGVCWCYTLFSLGLVGIPPTGGFVSKWYLAQGALVADVGIFSWLGPVVLLVSALLTAGYLLPIVMKGFFPGRAGEGMDLSRQKIPSSMLAPLIVLAGLVLLTGVLPGSLVEFASGIALQVLR